jgi:hypothetical protein
MPVTKSITLALLTIATLSSTAVAQQRIAVTKDTAARDTTTKVEMLFVQSAKGATLENGKLTLTGVGATTVFFSDRPKRIAGHVATPEMLSLWSEGKNSFLKDPPNATLSAFTDGGVVNTVVVLRNPVLTGDRMTYDVTVTQGNVPAKVDGASLFIDIIGMPLTPLSFAGAERRAYRRAVVWGYPY